MKNVIIKIEDLEALNEMSNEDRGKLLSGILEFHKTESEPDLTWMPNLAFKMMKPYFSLNMENYKKKVEAWKKFWHLWGRPKSEREEEKTLRVISKRQKTETPPISKAKSISKSKAKAKTKSNNSNELQSEIVWLEFQEEKKELKKEEYWNVELNKLLEFLKKLFERKDFKENQTWQRRYLKHISNLIEKDWREKIVNKLNILRTDKFKFKNCWSLKFIYTELKSLPDNCTVENFTQKVTTNF